MEIILVEICYLFNYTKIIDDKTVMSSIVYIFDYSGENSLRLIAKKNHFRAIFGPIAESNE